MSDVDESILDMCSIKSKNAELKYVKKLSKYGKETSSTKTNPYSIEACLEILQSIDLDMELQIIIFDHLMTLDT